MESRLYEILDEMDIKYKKLEHDAFATCEASGNFYKENDMGVDCKSAFLRNKQGKKHYLVVLLSQKRIDIPVLAESLGEKKKMGFASEERLYKFLGVYPGSVTPLALIKEESKEIGVVIDKEIFEHEFVHFHPLRNTASLKISTKDFKKFLEKYSGTEVRYLEFR